MATRDQFAVQHFPHTAAISEKFRAISEHVDDSGFFLRWHLLDLFAQAFGEELTKNPDAEPPPDARARLLKMLNQLPASDLLMLDFGELVRQMGCTPRHLSRVFREVVGMSFREKQAQVRLRRAQELLATTQPKVVEVALESGYQSLSLFNLMFKRRFGVSPALWRERVRAAKPAKSSDRTVQPARMAPGNRLRHVWPATPGIDPKMALLGEKPTEAAKTDTGHPPICGTSATPGLAVAAGTE